MSAPLSSADPAQAGEMVIRTVASGDPTIPPAYVIGTANGKVAVSWRGVRSPTFDKFDVQEDGTEFIRFSDGWMQFRAIRDGNTFVMPHMEEQPNLGWVMILWNRDREELSLVYDGSEYPAFEIQKIVHGERGMSLYLFSRHGATAAGVITGKTCGGGTPGFLVLMASRTVFLEIQNGGADVQVWVQNN